MDMPNERPFRVGVRLPIEFELRRQSTLQFRILGGHRRILSQVVAERQPSIHNGLFNGTRCRWCVRNAAEGLQNQCMTSGWYCE